MRTGWVYRSDAAPAIVQSVPSDAAPIVTRRMTPVQVEQRTAAPPPAPAGRGWFATGIYVMMLPMTMTFEIMFAPVNWILGARAKN